MDAAYLLMFYSHGGIAVYRESPFEICRVSSQPFENYMYHLRITEEEYEFIKYNEYLFV